VRTSNVLLIHAIAFATFSAIYGIANWTEHPDLMTKHAWLAAPSIWITEQIRRIQALPNAQAHQLQHCTFGGRTRKPTRLMTVNMGAELQEELKRYERPRAPTGCLIRQKNRWHMENVTGQRISKSNERRDSSSYGESCMQAPSAYFRSYRGSN